MDVELDGLFNQNTTYEYDDDYHYKDDFGSNNNHAVWIPVLYSVVLVVGVLGNGLLLVLLAQRWRAWSTSDIFILNLSVADILLLVTLPLWAAQATQSSGWSFGVPLCRISGGVFKINFYCGIFLLVCILLDRYLSIVHTKKLYTRKNPRLAHISCLLVWIISLLLSIPDWFSLELQIDQSWEDKTLCVPIFYHPNWQRTSRLIYHTLAFATTLIICCLCILLWLRRSSMSLVKRRAPLVTLILAVVFSLCWMPYNITLIAHTVGSSSKTPQENGSSDSSLKTYKTSLMITSALGCVHACLRPLLYLSLCRKFREWTLAALSCAATGPSGSLWELGIGGETLPVQNYEKEETQQIKSVEQQVQSTES